MMNKKRIKLMVSLLIAVILCVGVSSVCIFAAEPQSPTVQTVDYYDNYYDDYYDDYYDGYDDTYNNSQDMVLYIIWGIVGGVIGGGLSMLFVFLRYKNNGKSEPYPYRNKADLNLSQSNDLLVDTRVTRTKIR